MSDERTSPILAALYDHDHAAATELAAGRELDLFEAAALGDANRLQVLLRADPGSVARRSADGFTALHLLAYFSGDVAAARLLLDAGADPNAVADNGTALRPINSAAAAGATELVALLIARGADIDAAQRGGYTALHSAAANGNVALLRLLLDSGARCTTADDGSTPRSLATDRGHPQLAQELERRERGSA